MGFFKKAITGDELVLHYTGSVYGIGCSAFSKKGIEKINELKQRADGKGYIVLFPHISWLERYGLGGSRNYLRIAEQYSPGNLTLLFEDTAGFFTGISLNGKVAVRIPTDEALRDYLFEKDVPLISTSINVSGEEPIADLKAIKKLKWHDVFVSPEDTKSTTGNVSPIISEADNKLELIREGCISFAALEESYKTPSVLIVCTGNICRSPMAEYILKRLYEERNLKIKVSSAGVLESGNMISVGSKTALEENGYPEAAKHVSTELTPEIVQNSTLIITMTKNHIKHVHKMDQSSLGKTFTLLEYTDTCFINCDVEDPYGLEIEFYRKTFKQIKDSTEKLAELTEKEIL